MKVKLKTTLAGPALTANAGAEVHVDDTFGAALVAGGYAEAVVMGPPAGEQSGQSIEPEMATAAPQRRKK